MLRRVNCQRFGCENVTTISIYRERNPTSGVFDAGTCIYYVGVSLIKSQPYCTKRSFQMQLQVTKGQIRKELVSYLKNFKWQGRCINQKRRFHLLCYDTWKCNNMWCSYWTELLLLYINRDHNSMTKFSMIVSSKNLSSLSRNR